jgi:hypothetical protein
LNEEFVALFFLGTALRIDSALQRDNSDEQ